MNPTRAEKAYWTRLAEVVGCIACRIDGTPTNYVSIHHIDGRTKPGAHMNVLPLCAGHHQDGTGVPGLIAVHPYKARFEARYGKQRELKRICDGFLQQQGAVNGRTVDGTTSAGGGHAVRGQPDQKRVSATQGG